MPAFLNSMGQRVTADEARGYGGRLRAGYREILEDGESVSVDLAFMDAAASRSTVYLTDASSDDAQVTLEVALARAAHNRKFAFLGDKAPAFDAVSVEAIARSKVDIYNQSVRDAARDQRY